MGGVRAAAERAGLRPGNRVRFAVLFNPPTGGESARENEGAARARKIVAGGGVRAAQGRAWVGQLQESFRFICYLAEGDDAAEVAAQACCR